MLRILLLAGMLSANAFPQDKTILIQGRVVDMVGAVVPNAPVVAIDLDKLEVQQVRTSNQGDFRLELPAGRKYEVFATYQCMGTASKTFRTDKPRKLEIKLKVGNCGSTD